jgi:ABC-type uncharacterized transport system YnjBCD permease subunit
MTMTISLYQPWPRVGDSFSTASAVVCLATTNLAALLARLYIYMRRSQQRQFVTIIALCFTHVRLQIFFPQKLLADSMDSC